MTQLGALPYQVYLLAYDLDKHRLFDRTRTAFLTRAAVLIELALRGKLSVASQPLVTRWRTPSSMSAHGRRCFVEITGRR
jgi:hypothetical protein